MSTALIMFSVFFTGAVAARKDPGGSNVLMLCAMICLFAALSLWGYSLYHRAG